MRLFYFGGEEDASRWLTDRLSTFGFRVEFVLLADVQSCEGLESKPDVIIVELGLSGPDGREIAGAIRKYGMVQPILILSPQSEWQDRVNSLDSGADDYVVKPIRAEEVAARLRALIRRASGRSLDKISVGPIDLDLKAMSAWLNGQLLDLTRNEFRLLRLFLLRQDHTLLHHEIRDLLYSQSPTRSLNAIEVHISRLRRKIGHHRIQTIRGLGYRMIQQSETAHGFSEIQGPKSHALKAENDRLSRLGQSHI